MKNQQGDVVAVIDFAGADAATYSYDGWGHILTTGGYDADLAARNPLRYRGYYYDSETELYYLQSRYYNPALGRFICADGYVKTPGGSLLSANMFAYCGNNPVNYEDPTGELLFPGEIHNAVVRRIADEKGYYKEQIILYKDGGYGRADLISKEGFVWDVKRDRPGHILAGIKQVKKYTENTWRGHAGVKLHVGQDEGQSGYFNHKSGLITYEVEYRYKEKGVIVYDYRVKEVDYGTLVVGAALIGTLAAAAMTGGASIPAGAVALFALA